MTKRAAVTKADIDRMVRSAIEAGLTVTGISTMPDGTVTVATVPTDQGKPLEQHHDVVL